MAGCYVGGFATQEGNDMPSKKHGTHTEFTPWFASVCVSCHPSDKSSHAVGRVHTTYDKAETEYEMRVMIKLTVRSKMPNHCIVSISTAKVDSNAKEICHQTRSHDCKYYTDPK